jgi:hypothetical protein
MSLIFREDRGFDVVFAGMMMMVLMVPVVIVLRRRTWRYTNIGSHLVRMVRMGSDIVPRSQRGIFV